jgi:hypothetical protein
VDTSCGSCGQSAKAGRLNLVVVISLAVVILITWGKCQWSA